jgi:vacuolar-type H+-ATPase subunit H
MELIEEAVDIVVKAPGVLFTGRFLSNRQELLEILEEALAKLPAELKQAAWVKNERKRILKDAKFEAEMIVKEAENKVAAMTNDHEIIKSAISKGEEIVAKAKSNAKSVYNSSFVYADDLLASVERSVHEMMVSLKEIACKINDNRKSLTKVDAESEISKNAKAKRAKELSQNEGEPEGAGE